MQTEKINPEKILYDWTTQNIDKDIAELELESLPQHVKEGLLVADIGCGDGRHMVYFTLKGNETVGIDLHPEDEDFKILRRCKEYGLRPSIMKADARAIPLKTGAFHYVLCMGSALSEKYWLWLRSEDRRKWVEEMFRICKPEGLMILEVGKRYTSVKDSIEWIKHYVIAVISIVTGGKIEIGDYYDKECKCWFHSFTVNEVKNLFDELPVQIRIHKPSKRFFIWFMAFIRKTTV